MLQPYFTFMGQAEEAMNLYEKVFEGTDKQITRWGEPPIYDEVPITDNVKGKVMNGSLNIGGTVVSFSDTDPDFHAPETFAHSHFVSLAVDFDDEAKLRTAYAALIEEGQILMELEPQFFAKMYAWVQDKFGVSWQLFLN